MSYKRVSVQEAQDLIDNSNAVVVDVRDPASYQAGHLPSAESVDDSNVQAFVKNADSTRPVIVYCYHGNMSQGAADYFNRNGIEQTYSLDGGYEAWQASGTTASTASTASKVESMTNIEFSDLPSSARVWIYGAEKPLSADQIQALENHMAAFMTEWQSHGRPVTPNWKLVHDRFVVIGADEEAFALSGCSIDSMVRTLDEFNRVSGLHFTNSGGKVFYRDSEGAIECTERFTFGDLAKQGKVNEETVVFDNTVATVGDYLAGQWEKPMRESWHMDVFGKNLPSSAPAG